MHNGIPGDSIERDSAEGSTAGDENAIESADRLGGLPSPSPDPVDVCPDCGTSMPAAVAFCPGCGRTMQPLARARGKVGRFRENLAGALAYLTFIPAILFLVQEPYKRNRFVRFHSVQSVLFWALAALLALAIRVAAIVLLMIPVAGPLLLVLTIVIAALGLFLTWLVLLVKALFGEWFKLSILGDVAEQYADPIG